MDAFVEMENVDVKTSIAPSVCHKQNWEILLKTESITFCAKKIVAPVKFVFAWYQIQKRLLKSSPG